MLLLLQMQELIKQFAVYLQLSLNANTVTGGNWTGGTGTFTPNRNTANATYTPAAGEIGTTITLTWNAPDPMVLVLVLLPLMQ
jgi:hypothetical protein